MLFFFICDVLYVRMLVTFFFTFWSRITILLYWSGLQLTLTSFSFTVLSFTAYNIIYYTIILWFILFNLCSMILYCEISFLNTFVLSIILISIFSIYVLHFIFGFYTYIFASLLCGDRFMDVLIIRTLLCSLECFSLICRCIALFLRLFCNLLASHFLLTLFLDFIYFFICFIWFINVHICTQLFIFAILNVTLLIIILFYSFLICLDLFSVVLQLYILISMLQLGVNDWLILKFS